MCTDVCATGQPTAVADHSTPTLLCSDDASPTCSYLRGTRKLAIDASGLFRCQFHRGRSAKQTHAAKKEEKRVGCRAMLTGCSGRGVHADPAHDGAGDLDRVLVGLAPLGLAGRWHEELGPAAPPGLAHAVARAGYVPGVGTVPHATACTGLTIACTLGVGGHASACSSNPRDAVFLACTGQRSDLHTCCEPLHPDLQTSRSRGPAAASR